MKRNSLPSLTSPPSSRESLPAAAAGFLSAFLLCLSFPVLHNFQLWPLAWVALVPLLVQLSRGGVRSGIRQTVVFGYPMMVGVLAWVWWMGIIPWLLLAVTQTAYVGVFTLLSSWLAPLWAPAPGIRRVRSYVSHAAAITVFPAAWILMEWLRSLGNLSIPWGLISSTQVYLHPLVSTARWWGAYGVSFLIVMVNSAIANRILSTGEDRRRANVTLIAALAIVPIACTAAAVTFHPSPGRVERVGLIQGNIFKDDPNQSSYVDKVLRTYRRLSLMAARQHVDVIAWPETVVPRPLLRNWYVKDEVAAIAHETGSYLLVGSPDYTPEGDIYNSSFVLSPRGEILGQYSKEHLVPFGEVVPGRRWLPLAKYYGVPQKDTSPGVGHYPIHTPLGNLGIMICYESMYPQIARQTVQGGANLLFVITNDQWFGESSAPYDHAAAAAYRAAETGRWVMQAASTGVSLFADPTGRIYYPTQMFTQTVLTLDVTSQSGVTLYTALGDWPPILAIPFLAVFVAIRLWFRNRKRPGPTHDVSFSPASPEPTMVLPTYPKINPSLLIG